MLDREYFREITKAVGFDLSEKTISDFNLYCEQLLEWNEKINLTAITEPKEVAVKHFLDSFMLLKSVDIKQGSSLIDVGAGAGFPSLPIKLVRPDIKITMLDSLNKRVNFLNNLIIEIGAHAECIHGRAEDLGQKAVYREQFDVATARAVSKLNDLCEYCLPFVKKGGIFAAMKGPDCEGEISEAKTAIGLLGGEITDVKEFSLPDFSQRTIIIVKKISQTPTKYPRDAGKMKKYPL